MLLTNPIWLWALAGLAIPIGIHLLSRKEGKVIRIGSLRHLQETNTQQFKGIRLNEIVLLVLRCAIITLFVLLLSGLSFDSNKKSEVKWVLIEKGLENIREVKTQLDTFQLRGYELHWLADGFPLYADSTSVDSNILYWKLAEQIQTNKISDVIVFSKNRVEGFKGKRPSLAANIRWISVQTESVDFMLSAFSFSDSVTTRLGHSSTEKTYFTTQKHFGESSNQPISPIDSLKIVIVADAIHESDRRIVEASLEAMRVSSLTKIEVINSTSDKIKLTGYGNWCIWLADQPVSDSVGSNIIYLKPGLNQEVLVKEKSNRWIITKRLNKEIAWNENLTVKMAAILLYSEKDQRIALQNDKRMLPDESAWSNLDSGSASDASMFVEPAYSYLLSLFLLTFLIERILAYYRNQ